jgi:RepB DNA-primase from phage plasmid
VSPATVAERETIVIRSDRRRISAELPAAGQIELYARVVHAGARGLVEVVRARRLADGRLGRFERGAREWCLVAGEGAALAALVSEQLEAERRELFVTPAALVGPRGRNEAVAGAICAWVDLDDPERLEGLREFAHRPHLVVASGSGGRHAYWRLDRPVGREEIAQANRMLCERLGGDRQSTNPARLMRLPGSANWKSGEPAQCRILWADLASPGHEPASLLEGLRDPREPRPPARRSAWRGSDGERELDAVPPPQYFWAIAQIAVPEGGGHVRCPHAAHPDRHPSAYCYPESGRGWHCFSCGAGGGAVQLVAALRGLETAGLRGEAYVRCRSEALRRLGIERP